MSFNHQEMNLTRRILACVSAGLFFFYTIFQKVTFNVINVDLSTHFHLSGTELGAVSSAYLYANALWLIPGGILLEKFSSRAVTIIFLFACALSSFVFAESSSIALDVLMRFIGGLGSAMSLLISLRLAVRLFPNHAARVIGLLISLGMSAGIFANAPFLHLVQYIGWQNSLLAIGYFGVAIGIFMLFFLHDKVDSGPKKLFSFTALYRDIKNVSSNLINWKSGLYIGLMNLPIFVLASLWGNLYLVHTAGYTNDQASVIISMIFLGEITGAPIVGWISDKLQQRKSVMLVGAILSLATILPLFYSELFSPVMLSFIFFLLGFFISAQVLGYSVIAESNHPSVASTASGFCSFVVNMIGAVCQILFPLLLTIHLASNIASTPHSYKIAFCMFPIAFLASILVISYMKNTFSSALKRAEVSDQDSSEEKLLSHS